MQYTCDASRFNAHECVAVQNEPSLARSHAVVARHAHPYEPAITVVNRRCERLVPQIFSDAWSIGRQNRLLDSRGVNDPNDHATHALAAHHCGAKRLLRAEEYSDSLREDS